MTITPKSESIRLPVLDSEIVRAANLTRNPAERYWQSSPEVPSPTVSDLKFISSIKPCSVVFKFGHESVELRASNLKINLLELLPGFKFRVKLNHDRRSHDDGIQYLPLSGRAAPCQ